MAIAQSEPVDAPDNWQNYPSNLPEKYLLGLDAEYFNEQLTKLSASFCSEDEAARKENVSGTPAAQTHIRSICSYDSANGLTIKSRKLLHEAEAIQHIAGATSRRTEIFLLAQDFHFSPFPISERLLRKILTKYAVAPLFLDVLCGVSDETRISEESIGNTFYRTNGSESKGQKTIEISYQLKHADKSAHEPKFPWQVRHTEVFHRCTVEKGTPMNFWLVFQPVAGSRFERNLQRKADDAKQWRPLEANPVRQHLMLVSANVDNWRGYLASLAQEYQYHRRRIAAVKFASDEDFNGRLNFQSMQELRALEETIESVPMMLKTTSNLVHTLRRMNEELRTLALDDADEYIETHSALESISTRLEGYRDSADALLERTRGIIKLVTDALNLRNQNSAAANQKIAKDINETMLSLTLESVDDSYVVRVVTLATLIYLPGSFVASLFGMNFFDFGDDMSNMRIAANSWIYLAVTVPLTLLTALAWLVAAGTQKKKRDRKKLEAGEKA